jgi:hypothetical protein
MRRWICLGAPLLLCLALGAGARHDDAKLVVHEWGTFLAMAGSDGVTLDGMYHEEHALPPFVHARSKDQLTMRSVSLKGETPVIYFYTDQPQRVNVRVKFPAGIWTQWYPQASMVAPGLGATEPTQPAHGHICWNLDVIPPGNGSLADRLPPTSSDALWNYSRQVDAAFVRTAGGNGKAAESERFIFYRGLGKAKMPLQFASANGGTLTLGELPGGELKHLIVIRVENGSGTFRYIPSLSPGASLQSVIPSTQGGLDISSFSRKIGQELAERLTETGLYRKEAEAMVNTWRKSYFESEGVRVLFVLPQQWTDKFIPMSVYPAPAKMVRVMVGRTELLTPAREAQAEKAILQLTSADSSAREKAYAFLRDQGRYVEPVINRVCRITQKPRVKEACSRLLMTPFATELRSAAHRATDGSRLDEKSFEVKANLAALLRELGYAQEAAEEAKQAEAELLHISVPMPNDSENRWYLRALARAKEGAGDDRGALETYAKLVRFGSLSKTCGNCHDAAGPRSMAFYRDWWAGRKYAEYAAKLGLMEESLRDCREKVNKNSADTASQMMLAYLAEHKGDGQTASRLWDTIESDGRRAAALNPKRRNARVAALPD